MSSNSTTSLWKNVDWVTIVLFLILLTMGWFSICGACYDPEESTSLVNISTRTGMQLVWIGSSVLLGFFLLLLDDRLYDTFAYLIYILLLCLLFITPFLAHDIKGSLSWIKIGSFSLQSAEFAKFATALALAKFMGHQDFNLQGSWKNMLICFIILGLPLLLIIMQHETGSALIYFSLLLVLYREGMHGSVLIIGIATIIYFIVGISYSTSTILSGTTNLGELLVLLIILAFLLLLTVCYVKKHKGGSIRDRKIFDHSRTIIYVLIIGFGFGGTLIAMLVAHLYAPFNICLVTLATILLIAVTMFFYSVPLKLTQYTLIGIFALGSLGFFYSSQKLLTQLAPHQQNRVLVLLGLKDDPSGLGYNVIQAKIAIGSGGLTGKGFLNGTQTKLKYVPEQETDFIFCTIGEEQGFIGSTIVLLTFLALLLRLLYLAERQPYTFGRVYGYCVFSIILFHLLINVGMVLGIMPVIGIPLPFFSYGGSSLWGFTLLLFIFLRIDASRNRLRR